MITSLSTHRLQIASNFVGSEIVLFGAIERDAQTISRTGTYDIAVVVRGPRGTVVTRQKSRVLGIWMNTRSREFIDVPTAYSVVTNRPTGDIADLDLRKRHQIGLDGLILLQTARLGEEAEAGQPFRDAFVRINQARGLYIENPTGITFLSPTLFRANIRVVPNTPVGTFDVDIFLLSGRRHPRAGKHQFRSDQDGIRGLRCQCRPELRVLLRAGGGDHRAVHRLVGLHHLPPRLIAYQTGIVTMADETLANETARGLGAPRTGAGGKRCRGSRPGRFWRGLDWPSAMLACGVLVVVAHGTPDALGPPADRDGRRRSCGAARR